VIDSTVRVAVVGAGPGGLTCARILRHEGIAVTVFDQDASPDARAQGGSLDMHADSGQIALREAGLLDRFFALCRPEAQAMRMLDRTGRVLRQVTPEPGELSCPEIDRGQLRALLLDSVAPDTVRWGKKVRAVEPLGHGVHRLRFADGDTADFDLVIGADGTWSKVRPLLSDAVPGYTGVTFLDVLLHDVDRRHPEIAELVGEGGMGALTDFTGFMAHRLSDGAVDAHICLRADLDWHVTAGLDLTDTAAVRDHLLTAFADWDPRFLRLITEADGPFVHRPLYALPVPYAWEPRSGLTLLGDAAHVMSPFGGHGANLAMLDGADLAHALVRSDDVDAAVSAYEAVMQSRAAEAGREASLTDESDVDDDGPDFEAERRGYLERAAELTAQRAALRG
jgi:2-polyprenyl-6-methoxyphenol hydroxylase-like FAD-dependent oxidoreductase